MPHAYMHMQLLFSTSLPACPSLCPSPHLSTTHISRASQAVCFVDLLTLASDRRLQITQESRRLNDKISGLARLPAAGASLSEA